MIKGITEKSLLAALEAVSLRELPSRYNNESSEGKTFWVKAVVLVRKRNGTLSYVLAERGGNKEFHVKRDFGLMSPITNFLEVYPYMYLDERFLLDANGSQYHYAIANELGLSLDKVKTLGKEELEALAIDVAIKRQKGASVSVRNEDDFERELREVELSEDANIPTVEEFKDVTPAVITDTNGIKEEIKVLASAPTEVKQSAPITKERKKRAGRPRKKR